MNSLAQTQTPETATHNPLKEAFDATAKARAELFPDDLLAINIDVRQAINTVLGTLPRLAGLREQIVATFKDFDLAQFDAIESYAYSLAFAHPEYLGAVQPSDPLPELATRAMALRDQLLGDVNTLARHKLLDGKRIAEVQGGNGYLNVAYDLATLVSVLRASWSNVVGKSAIEASHLEEANGLYLQMTMALAGRTQPSKTAAAASDDRQRAYTLLVNAYDQARRAATYLRWKQDDVDSIVPSLWKGRGGRGGSKEPVVSAPVDGDAPTVPEGDQPIVPQGDSPVVPVNG